MKYQLNLIPAAGGIPALAPLLSTNASGGKGRLNITMHHRHSRT
jgi:hypothetical protein